MSLPKTILVPTDFGAASQAAITQAVDLARKLEAEVVVMHAFEIPVLGLPEGPVVGSAEITSRILEGAQAGLDDILRRYQDKGVRVRTLLRQGDPWKTVVDVADELSAGLIVMGTHGRRGLPRALIGSVAEKVVRTANVPVLTVHAEAEKTATA